eukprot:g14566.t1
MGACCAKQGDGRSQEPIDPKKLQNGGEWHDQDGNEWKEADGNRNSQESGGSENRNSQDSRGSEIRNSQESGGSADGGEDGDKAADAADVQLEEAKKAEEENQHTPRKYFEDVARGLVLDNSWVSQQHNAEKYGTEQQSWENYAPKTEPYAPKTSPRVPRVGTTSPREGANSPRGAKGAGKSPRGAKGTGKSPRGK